VGRRIWIVIEVWNDKKPTIMSGPQDHSPRRSKEANAGEINDFKMRFAAL